jgi:hypothetical protein
MAYFINNFDNKPNLYTTVSEVILVGNGTEIEVENISDDDDNLYMDVEQKLVVTIIWSILVMTGVFGKLGECWGKFFVKYFLFIGNGFVIFTIIKSRKFNNVIQCYLLNLAITDLLFVIFCIPITTLTYVQDHWVFGKFLCKIFHFAAFVSFFICLCFYY